MIPVLVLLAGACTSEPEERAVDTRITPDGTGDSSTTSSTTEPDPGDEDDGSENGRLVESGTYSCDEHPDIVIPGSHLEVELTGHCTSVRLEGSGHEVEIESVDGLTVTGANHQAEVTSAASQITIEGANHDIRYPEEAATAVDDQSTNSHVEAG